MTFEEFFSKKKINLNALEVSNTEMYTELKNHYELMGPKSFDHSKKFLFNKLRNEFPILPTA